MAANVMTIAQQKGGAGKSTLAIHLAVAWSALGKRVAIVDIDPQASVSQWDERRGQALNGHRVLDGADLPHVVKLSGWRTVAEVERLGRGHDIVLIDTPPHPPTHPPLPALPARPLI